MASLIYDNKISMHAFFIDIINQIGSNGYLKEKALNIFPKQDLAFTMRTIDFH